ncbi:conjugal transfer protein TraF [Vibrio metschnikovii]|uniref:conjugal transfer protein TraF n=1 Tax=Vibrio TaxID=662 RepID=UPI0013025712|nr:MULTISPECIES: conjugal transfer protein TraF [Vibrio]EKO3793462.1 conjugal transfer protein TraF [Vibrio metschnikovii]EKO3925305.1 conjugal transfer protein TraF [Vibrio metschnikovii]NAW63158.1 conjugal transfer protein TraF [Vibrio sp. V31_P5A7T61]NAX02901.1 conjugal transfer protein TraF [Vibrio sp. V34_P3A8T189]NAX07088.1 conjugal transfer protein TraF [Vibrio sp. V40_P2S30T141]
MNSKKHIWLLTLPALLVATETLAANYAIEARGDAMGGVGVVSANYLTAPFYNPALVAIYRRNDDAGMILPSVGFTYNDPDKLVKSIDNIADLINSNDPSKAPELQAALNDIDGNTLNANLGGVIAFGIPNRYISANIFGKAYTEVYAAPSIASDCPVSGANPSSPECILEQAQNSGINAVSIAVTEVGISLAKYQTFLGQHMAFGITPKLQRIYTYVYQASFNNYEFKDLLDNGTGETTFNIDAGAVWFYGPYRLGAAATNLISRDISTQTVNSVQYDYQIRPQITLGAGIVADYATLSVDYDLNTDRRFNNFADDTQMIRIGGEVDIMRQLKLRVGYNKNLAYSGRDGTITAGIGLSPLNIIQLDIGASYTNENAMGAYINFLASY